jgi:hypothetical protein
MHRTATRALLCLVRDRHRQAKNGRYSDKRLYVSYDADERDKEWIETFEVMDDFEKSQHSSRSRVVAQ